MTVSNAPARTVRFVRPGAAVLLAAALTLGACTTADDEANTGSETTPQTETTEDGEQTTQPTDGGDGTAETGEAGGDLPFGEDEPDVEPAVVEVEDLTDLSAPDEVIAEVEAELPDTSTTEDVLDSIEPIDSDLELTTDRDGRTTNAEGQTVGLDEQASLACANIEIALTALDEGDGQTAADQITTAADRAANSAMASVQEWSRPLADAVIDGSVAEVAPLVGFISVCAEGGYEL